MKRTPAMERRRGVTMLELLVVLAILGVIGSVVGLGFRSAAPAEPGSLEDAWSVIRDARGKAVREGRAVVVIATLRDALGTSVTHHATALPDGSVIADSALGVSRLAGAREPTP